MNQHFNKGLILTSLGSFWWGFIGVIYFEYVAFIGHVELVVHRCLWTAVMLVMTTLFLNKWKLFIESISNKKNLFYLFISGSLIFINWAIWIYAVATERIIDASFGYFIMPIISVLLGYIFFKEKLNKKRIFSILLVIISILIMIFLNIKTLPWVGIIVALSWAFYNLVRKKINIIAVQKHLCTTNSMCPIKATYSKYNTPMKPHQNEPSDVNSKPLLNSLFIVNLRIK